MLTLNAAHRWMPRVSEISAAVGLPTPFPLYAAILAVFAHHLRGAVSAAGVGPAIVAASATALVFQDGSGWLLRRTRG